MKALEALEKLTNYGCSKMSEKIECKELIETALKELRQIKMRFKMYKIEDVYNLDVRLMNYELAKKKLKALEIIKEKPYLLLFTDFNLTYEEFVEQAEEDYGNDLPTKEEFDLLKEVLK